MSDPNAGATTIPPLRPFWRRQPWGALGALVLGWLVLAAANHLLRARFPELRTPPLFPITLFAPPRLEPSGLPAAAAFVGVLVWTHARAPRLGGPALVAAGLALIALGNLAQGGFDAGFVAPLRESGVQYSHEALAIGDAAAWLRGFNEAQPGLLVHSRTHPPFAVLLHVALLRLGGGALAGLAAGLVLLSAVALELFRRALVAMAVEPSRRGPLVLLCAALPSVNVFSAVSLDGVILVCAAAALLGLAMVTRADAQAWTGAAVVATGTLAMSLLTFASLFLVGLVALVAAWAFVRERRAGPALALAVTLALLAAALVALRALCGYDHLEALRVAARLENPSGFLLFAAPARYMATRLENVAEIAFFFSFGALAIALRHLRARALRAALRDRACALAAFAAFVLLAMFAAGAFKTGETARACLFVVPFLLLPFARLSAQTIGDLVALAGAQTAVMQLFGRFFW